MATDPAIVLTLSPEGPQFSISEQAVMPVVTATATLQGLVSAPKTPVQFRWTATLRFAGQGCVHAMGKITTHPVMAQATTANTFTLPFAHVRGGDLSVGVSVTVDGKVLTAHSHGLQVVGANPSLASVATAALGSPDAFKKLIRLESAVRQFRSPTCPLFSADNLGGVGLCQLTPPSNDDEIWSWKANVAGGLALYRSKETTARNYPAHVRASATFRAQVKAYNDQRAQSGSGATPPVVVTVPDYTADQLQLDTIRAFNGYAGGLHEYQLKTDDDDLLVVTLAAGGRTGTAEWERITPAQRTAHYVAAGVAAGHRGDPNYVDDVMRQASF